MDIDMNMVETQIVEVKNEREQKAQELEQNFSYDGYQVVRRELFAHLRDPAVVIRYGSVTFNTACIKGLEDAVYIQMLINTDVKKMVIRKCEEDDKDALRWCVANNETRKTRKVVSKIFSPMIYEAMGWNHKCRYKILGYKISYKGETLYVFDLNETEIYLENAGRKKRRIEQGENVEQLIDKEQIKMLKQPYYPEGWKECFGLPVFEHDKALEVNVVDGYATIN